MGFPRCAADVMLDWKNPPPPKRPMRPLVITLLVAATLHGQNVPADLHDIAERAYVYAYPLVLLEATRGAQSVNQFTHVPQFPRPDIRQIVRPNADTLYSTAWLDLAKEPILIHVPDSGGRFYLLQFMDAWTETFADPGKRTTGTTEAWFAVVGPNWKAHFRNTSRAWMRR